MHPRTKARDLLKSFFNRFGYDVRRYLPDPPKRLNVLDLAIRALHAATPDLFVLQVGANDGVLDDPIHDIIRRYHLEGLLMEPMPNAFLELQENYRDQPQVRLENAALSYEDGFQLLYFVNPEAYANRRVRGMAGFDRSVFLRCRGELPGLEKNLEAIKVRTVSLSTLREKHNLHRVDVLQVDTEGFDDEVIKMILSEHFAPLLINFEHIHLSPEKHRRCYQILCDHNYALLPTGMNTLAVLNGR